jgi:hypothetical protein
MGTTQTSTRLQRDQFWRLQYMQRRYLEHITDDDLAQRTRDVICNLTVLTDEGKVGLLVPDHVGAYWMEIFTHILEEYSLRGNGLPHGLMKGASLPKPTWPHRPRAEALLKNAQFDPALHMVKFGKAEYLRHASGGRWRITPASFYKDPSLGTARQDHELKRTVFGLQNEVEITILNQQTGEPIAKTHPIGDLAVTQESRTDYYVICLSRSLSLRLFDDFTQSDSCIIIRNIPEFVRRIFAAFRRLLSGWHGKMRDVMYYDPFNPPRERDLFFSKHFGYAYQREIRFVWLPPEAKLDLKVHDLEAGSMSDICDFLVLPER